MRNIGKVIMLNRKYDIPYYVSHYMRKTIHLNKNDLMNSFNQIEENIYLKAEIFKCFIDYREGFL
jgi:hypothetical protein